MQRAIQLYFGSYNTTEEENSGRVDVPAFRYRVTESPALRSTKQGNTLLTEGKFKGKAGCRLPSVLLTRPSSLQIPALRPH